MKIVNYYGFSVDYDSGRVYLTEGRVAGYIQQIPTGDDGIAKGSLHGDVINKNPKVALNADANLLYIDLAGKEYPDQIHEYEHLPHTADGRLLMDSVGKITRTYKGLGFTDLNAVALYKAPKPEPADEEAVTGAYRYETIGDYRYASYNLDEGGVVNATRTKTGEKLELEVLMVGAGGCGKGQTTTMAKGGDGGGGELAFGKLPATASVGIAITLPKGGDRSSDSPANTTVVENGVTLKATSGKSATDKNDAAGFGKQSVPDGWKDLWMFTWLLPGSREVGGSAWTNEQNYPNATYCGEGGAGTKDNRPGTGNNGFVAIRWKK